jgi:hypothetical protein
MGALSNASRHAAKCVESGRIRHVSWPSMAQTGRPGVRGRWARRGGRDHHQVHSPRAITGRYRMARLPRRSSCRGAACGSFWTRARGQRELADERTGRLKSSARLQGLFKGGLDIPPTHVQFSSLRREHPSGRSVWGRGEEQVTRAPESSRLRTHPAQEALFGRLAPIRSRPPVNCVATSKGHRATDVRPGRI